MHNTACTQIFSLGFVQRALLSYMDYLHDSWCLQHSERLRICKDRIMNINTDDPGLPLINKTIHFLQRKENTNKKSTLKELDGLMRDISQRDPHQYDFKANHCLDRCLTDLQSQQEIKKAAFNALCLCAIRKGVIPEISYFIGQFADIVPACLSNATPPTDNNHSTTTTLAPQNNI